MLALLSWVHGYQSQGKGASFRLPRHCRGNVPRVSLRVDPYLTAPFSLVPFFCLFAELNRMRLFTAVSCVITHFRKDPSKRETVSRLLRLKGTLESGAPPSNNQLKPFKERIGTLRRSIQGKKDIYRNTVAKEVVRAVQDVRIGKISDAVAEFQSQYGAHGTTVLVTEYHKGKGPGHYKARPVNRTLAAIGASKVYQLILEKGAFTTPAVPIVTLLPSKVRKECPSCGHSHSSNPSRDTFGCSSCGEKMPVGEVAASNLAKNFFTPPPPKSETAEERVEKEAAEEPESGVN